MRVTSAPSTVNIERWAAETLIMLHSKAVIFPQRDNRPEVSEPRSDLESSVIAALSARRFASTTIKPTPTGSNSPQVIPVQDARGLNNGFIVRNSRTLKSYPLSQNVIRKDVDINDEQDKDSKIQTLTAEVNFLQSQLKKKAESPVLPNPARFKRKSDTSDEESSKIHRFRPKREIRQSMKTEYNNMRRTSISDDSVSEVLEEDLEDSDYDEDSDEQVNTYNSRRKSDSHGNSDLVPIGNGHALVPMRLLRQLDKNSHTTATRKLLTAIFPRRVLATHSLTGKPSPAFPNKPAKKKLDPAIVNDIIQTVVEHCGVPENLVRTSITTKCADESKMFRTRQQKQKKKTLKKENLPPSSIISEA